MASRLGCSGILFLYLYFWCPPPRPHSGRRSHRREAIATAFEFGYSIAPDGFAWSVYLTNCTHQTPSIFGICARRVRVVGVPNKLRTPNTKYIWYLRPTGSRGRCTTVPNKLRTDIEAAGLSPSWRISRSQYCVRRRSCAPIIRAPTHALQGPTFREQAGRAGRVVSISQCVRISHCQTPHPFLNSCLPQSNTQRLQ